MATKSDDSAYIPNDESLHGCPEVAAFLGITRETLIRWVEAGLIPAKRIFSRYRFIGREVHDYIHRMPDQKGHKE